jgi:hypothetical protein
MAANELTIRIWVNPDDPNDKTIYYQINDNPEEFLLKSDGSSGNFQTQLGQIVGPKFLDIFNDYQSKHTMLHKLSTFKSKIHIPKLFSVPTKVHPEPTGGKKTKSKRSYNSNKTLKNRK